VDEAVKDNDFIYHSKVPELNTIKPVGKAALAKTTAIKYPMSEGFSGIAKFYNLCVKTRVVSCSEI
jgi:hypothetical protein